MSRKRRDYTNPVYMQSCETWRQREVLKCVLDSDTHKEAAEKLGISYRVLLKTLGRIERNATKRNLDEHTGTNVPENYLIKGTSSLVDSEGNTRLKWVKTSLDQQKQQESLTAMCNAMCSELPIVDKIKSPAKKYDNQDVIPFFNIGDAHLGMLAHQMEVGHNFDMKIAERELTSALFNLMDRTAGYERCVIQDMGDFTHYENMAGVTEGHGHALDIDTRFTKLIEVYTRTMRSIIEYALARFKYVDVIINQGNHSRTNDIWMCNFLKHVYQKNKRLHILDNSSVFIGYRMGDTFVMSHHSDKCKHNKLVDVMATDFREHFGECKYKYIDIGHIHHKMQAKEYGDVTIESFNQLAPSDKYAHDGGWRSRSFLTCVLRSKKYGEIGREIITAEQVQDELSLQGFEVSKSTKNVYTV